jgi:hypothetical protein
MAVGGRVIFETIFFDSAGGLVISLFFLGGWCVALTTGAVRLLKYLHKEVTAELQS